MNNVVLSSSFSFAIEDYLFLLERGYSARSVLPLVCNRYGLSSTQRIVLYRGIDTAAASTRRSFRITESCMHSALSIDLFNVLFTVTNYLYGRVLYISTDGFVRDNGEEFPRQQLNPVLERALGYLFTWIIREDPESVTLYADLNYETAARIIDAVAIRIASVPCPVRIMQMSSPDNELAGVKEGVIASSDAKIIDGSGVPVLDAAHEIIRETFSAAITDLRIIVSVPRDRRT